MLQFGGVAAIALSTTSLQAVSIYEDPSFSNSLLFHDFTSAPGSVSFNNAQFNSTSGGGTTTYGSNAVTTDPQIAFAGGSLDLNTYSNFRARYSITGANGAVNAWRNPAAGGQQIVLPNGGGSFVEGTGTIPNPVAAATGFRVDPVTSGVGWTIEMDYIRIDSTPTIGYEFDNANDQMGLTINAANYASSSFNNGSFVAQANAGGGAASDVNLNFGASVRPDADIYKWVELRMKADAGDRIDLFFSNTTNSSGNGFTVIDLTGAGQTDGQFHTYLLDMSDEADWSGTLDFLRLDPSSNSSANFEIDYVRFLADATVPEPASTSLAALGALLLLRRRR